MISKVLCVTLITLTFSFSTAYAEKKDTVKNYKRYKSFAAPKKERLNDKWSDFKKKTDWDNLSDKERRELKKRVYNKRR